MNFTPDQFRHLRREARRRLPGLLMRVIMWNVLAVYLVFFIFSGNSGRGQATARDSSPAVDLLRHPATLAAWAVLPSAFIWVFYRSMSAKDPDLRGGEIPTRFVAVAMIVVQLVCVGGLWVFIR